MNKNLSTLLLAGIMTIGLVGCGGNKDASSLSGNQNTSSSVSTTETSSSLSESTNVSSEETSVIKELAAVSENVEVKIGEQVTTSNYYNLVGYKSLTAKQKKVTITSSDENVIKVASTYKTMSAVSIGTAVITVVSNVDTTKSCSFTINVTEAFFDRTITSINSTWDVSHEMDETNPYIKVDTNLADGIYARNSDGLKWYIETSITVHSVDATEQWPKFGIVANTTSNTLDTNNNKLYFFLDAPMNSVDNWVNFGVCEVANGSNWAWNVGIGNNEARHHDAIYTASSPITYEQTFKMGMVRDGFNCHLYINDTYVKSVTVLGTLFGNYDNETSDYTSAANCMAGFFSFNSTVTFSNYSFTNVEEEVNAKLPAEYDYLTAWADD